MNIEKRYEREYLLQEQYNQLERCILNCNGIDEDCGAFYPIKDYGICYVKKIIENDLNKIKQDNKYTTFKP